MPLLDRTESVLAIIDVQERFYAEARLAGEDGVRLALTVDRCAWLAGIAAAFSVPAVVTEEDPARNGPTAGAILARLPAGTPRLPKPVFGLADVPEILAAVEATKRRTVVLAGLETDVCVAQSALGLVDRGFRVVAVTDALFSPGAMHEHGLARMRAAGVELVHAKGVYYEWARTLEAARAFEIGHPDLADPPGFGL
jgi:nicotinamidase-related amidase